MNKLQRVKLSSDCHPIVVVVVAWPIWCIVRCSVLSTPGGHDSVWLLVFYCEGWPQVMTQHIWIHTNSIWFFSDKAALVEDHASLPCAHFDPLHFYLVIVVLTFYKLSVFADINPFCRSIFVSIPPFYCDVFPDMIIFNASRFTVLLYHDYYEKFYRQSYLAINSNVFCIISCSLQICDSRVHSFTAMHCIFQALKEYRYFSAVIHFWKLNHG